MIQVCAPWSRFESGFVLAFFDLAPQTSFVLKRRRRTRCCRISIINNLLRMCQIQLILIKSADQNRVWKMSSRPKISLVFSAHSQSVVTTIVRNSPAAQFNSINLLQDVTPCVFQTKKSRTLPPNRTRQNKTSKKNLSQSCCRSKNTEAVNSAGDYLLILTTHRRIWDYVISFEGDQGLYLNVQNITIQPVGSPPMSFKPGFGICFYLNCVTVT